MVGAGNRAEPRRDAGLAPEIDDGSALPVKLHAFIFAHDRVEAQASRRLPEQRTCGAGRFLILARDDVVEPNLVWSDTVLVRTGETVDILLDVANPGLWMAHCHIAEHHESGMMFSFNVTP